jgi:hypothetical protein
MGLVEYAKSRDLTLSLLSGQDDNHGFRVGTERAHGRGKVEGIGKGKTQAGERERGEDQEGERRAIWEIFPSLSLLTGFAFGGLGGFKLFKLVKMGGLDT